MGSEAPEDSRIVPDGRIKIKRHNVAGVVGLYVKYGPRTENLQDISFAQVWEEDLPILRQVGAAVWKSIMWTKEIVVGEFLAMEEVQQFSQ
jgi:hypothetical protein